MVCVCAKMKNTNPSPSVAAAAAVAVVVVVVVVAAVDPLLLGFVWHVCANADISSHLLSVVVSCVSYVCGCAYVCCRRLAYVSDTRTHIRTGLRRN